MSTLLLINSSSQKEKLSLISTKKRQIDFSKSTEACMFLLRSGHTQTDIWREKDRQEFYKNNRSYNQKERRDSALDRFLFFF